MSWEKYDPVLRTWVLDEEKTRENWSKATVADGLVRWKSNGAVPPQECLDAFAAVGFVFDMGKCVRTRDAELAAFLGDYRKRNANRVFTSEERAEMRAAFGPGVEVVDVVTGRRVRT